MDRYFRRKMALTSTSHQRAAFVLDIREGNLVVDCTLNLVIQSCHGLAITLEKIGLETRDLKQRQSETNDIRKQIDTMLGTDYTESLSQMIQP